VDIQFWIDVYFDLLPFFKKYSGDVPRKEFYRQSSLYWLYDDHFSIKGSHLAGLLVSKYIMENNLLNIKDKERRLQFINKKLGDFHHKDRTQ